MLFIKFHVAIVSSESVRGEFHKLLFVSIH